MDLDIFNKAQNIIAQNKKKAEDASQHNLVVLLQFEDVKLAYTALKTAEIENAKAEVYEKPAPHNLQKLQQNYVNAIKAHGKNPQILLPDYHCKICNDNGYENGKLCLCLNKEINNLILKDSNIKRKFKCFEDADNKIIENNNNLKLYYTKLRNWCNTENNILNILLSGFTGTGKTFLMECMASQLINSNKTVFWTTAYDLNQKLLAFHISRDINKKYILEYIFNCEYLFIDDLGTEPILNNVTTEGLYRILAERIEKNLHTVISTNLDLNAIAETYEERIFSRLSDKKNSLVLNFTGKDLRLNK